MSEMEKNVRKRSVLVTILTVISLAPIICGILFIILFLLAAYAVDAGQPSALFPTIASLMFLLPLLPLILSLMMGFSLVFGIFALGAAVIKHAGKMLPISALVLACIEIVVIWSTVGRVGFNSPLNSAYSPQVAYMNFAGSNFSDDFSPLMKASQAGRVEEVRRLLKQGEDPFRKSTIGWTACGLAVSKGEFETVKAFLEESPAMESDKDYLGVLLRLAAMANPNNDIAKLLLAHNPNVNMQGQEKTTPLMWAANSGNVELVKLLIERGADVNLRDAYNDSAMMYAGRNGQIDVLRLLKSAGAKE